VTGVLEIDVGNSRLKWRRIRDGRVLDRGALLATLPLEPGELVGDGPVPALARVGSVAGADFDRELEARLRQLGIGEVRFAASSDRCGRLRAGYREPTRMGVDRWLALVAGSARVEGAFAVLDAGSALTLDLVDADGRHLGGWILPGLRMMRRALLDGTAGVRFPEPDAHADPGPGRDTGEAVVFGTLLMARDFVAGRMERFRRDCPGAPLLVTGGDGEMLLAEAQPPVERIPDLVLDGLAAVTG
jgi:type III pantothenate kinase